MRRPPFITRIILTALALCPFAPPTAAQPAFRGLGRLSGYDAQVPQGISADGTTVVGAVELDPKNIFPLRGFRWTADSGFSVLPSIGPIPTSNAHAVSADGAVIVGQNGYEAYAWTGSGAHKQNLGVYGNPPQGAAYGASARSVSADGSVIVGASISDLGQHAFRWTAQTGMTSLGYLAGTNAAFAEDTSADGSVAVGWATPSGGISRAFRWSAATGMHELSLSPSQHSRATAVSADGSTVVGWSEPAGQARAFRWTQSSGPLDLGTLGDFSQAIDVSADGRVIVGFAEEGAFVWDAAHGMRPLKSVLTAGGIDLTGWQLSAATGVSADGTVITGTGLNPAGQSEGWIARIDVPEPNLTVIAVAGCALLRRRRTRAIKRLLSPRFGG